MRGLTARFHSGVGILVLVLMGAAGCSERERPFTDVLLEEAQVHERQISITHPTSDFEYLQIHFTSSPGVRVSFTGRYIQGDRLVALAFSNENPFDAFYIAEAGIGSGEPPNSFQILVTEAELGNAEEVAIIIWVEDSQRRRMQGDSVHVRLR